MVTGKSDRNIIIPETSSQHFNRQIFLLSKRKTESIHTEETFSSPSKRLKLSTFRQNLRFWSSKDTPSGSDMAGPNGELTRKTEGQGNWRQDGMKRKVL